MLSPQLTPFASNGHNANVHLQELDELQTDAVRAATSLWTCAKRRQATRQIRHVRTRLRSIVEEVDAMLTVEGTPLCEAQIREMVEYLADRLDAQLADALECVGDAT